MLARMARPVASPTPWGPPVAWKPYQQWISVTSYAKTRILTIESITSRPEMKASK